mgnify:FL=1
MKRTERIETVEGLIKSIKDSLEKWDAVEECEKIMTGCNVKRTDSRNSIINRCMIARSELLNIMDDLKNA